MLKSFSASSTAPSSTFCACEYACPSERRQLPSSHCCWLLLLLLLDGDDVDIPLTDVGGAGDDASLTIPPRESYWRYALCCSAMVGY